MLPTPMSETYKICKVMRKMYDMDIGGSYNGGPFVVKTEDKEASVVIECECARHMLKVEMQADIYTNSDGSVQVHQTYFLAMFQHGNKKRGFFGKMKIALKYLWTGRMFNDQLTFTPDEATKLSEFITSTKIETLKNE